jgi:hypothetical protein
VNIRYLIVLDNIAVKPAGPLSNLVDYEVDPELTKAEYRGVVLERSVAGPDNDRVDSACAVRANGKRYRFMTVGRRLHQKIGLAIAQAIGPDGDGDSK